jgi:peptidylprolyl isomerase
LRKDFVLAQQYSKPFDLTLDSNKSYTATLETNHGSIDVELFPEDAPNTVNNFVSLAREGYYDGTPFHRIIKGFMIQGGDPTGTGAGGPGYKFNDEKVVKDYEPGTLAMANAGPNTNGSQFFICHVDLKGRLPKNYTIFGKVTNGLDVVDKIASVPVRASRSGEPSSPVDPVTLDKVTVSEA